MLSIENLSKGFGGQELFDNVSLKINSRERVGLVGRNGHGKTTLIRIISGEESADSGRILCPGNYRIGYVSQQLAFTEDTVLNEGVKGLPDHEKDQLWKVEKILTGLGFSEEDLNRHPSEFSGGYQVRLNLTKALVSEPDLLLLDEPTNYLDITSIRWIESFLKKWPHELILITHDRSFMDAVVTHTIGIHRARLKKIQGNTEKYYTQIAQEEEIYEKTRVNDEKRKKELELFISRFRAKARLANMVQSRIKTLSKMDKKEKLEEISTLEFSFRSKPFKAKQMLQASEVTFSYRQDTPLIQDVSITVNAGDRVCIVGKNGKGKTTLLKLLAGELEPDAGNIVLNPGVDRGFYEQTNIKTLNDDKTIEEEIEYCHPEVDKQLARNICGAMMFQGDMALKKIGVLSGGEKSRIMLGKLLVTPVNLLLLDEPTNHLDMESCDSLLAAIDAFDGAVIMVTHNEMFLHALAKRLIVFKNDTIEVFDGTYSEFLEKIGWDEDGEELSGDQVVSVSEDSYRSEGVRLGKKELRKKRSEIISRRSKELNPFESRMKTLESDIEACEIDIASLNEEILKASEAGDGPKIAELSKKIHEKQKSVDDYFDVLAECSDEYDRIKAEYDVELENLDNIM